MRIFLTGSTGLVGSNLRRKLDECGYTVLAPTRQELNLLHLENILAYCLDVKPDMIIHAAGKVGGIQANMIDLILLKTQYTEIIISTTTVKQPNKDVHTYSE